MAKGFTLRNFEASGSEKMLFARYFLSGPMPSQEDFHWWPSPQARSLEQTLHKVFPSQEIERTPLEQTSCAYHRGQNLCISRPFETWSHYSIVQDFCAWGQPRNTFVTTLFSSHGLQKERVGFTFRWRFAKTKTPLAVQWPGEIRRDCWCRGSACHWESCCFNKSHTFPKSLWTFFQYHVWNVVSVFQIFSNHNRMLRNFVSNGFVQHVGDGQMGALVALATWHSLRSSLHLILSSWFVTFDDNWILISFSGGQAQGAQGALNDSHQAVVFAFFAFFFTTSQRSQRWTLADWWPPSWRQEGSVLLPAFTLFGEWLVHISSVSGRQLYGFQLVGFSFVLKLKASCGQAGNKQALCWRIATEHNSCRVARTFRGPCCWLTDWKYW